MTVSEARKDLFGLIDAVAEEHRGYCIVCTRNGRRLYLQVAYLMPTAETREREFAALASVPDQYRKVVLSMDTVDFSRDGIEHVHLPDFLLADKEGGLE